jgi:hypothetical protein
LDDFAHRLADAIADEYPEHTANTIEGVLYVDEGDKTADNKTTWKCRYYLVDVGKRVLFWLQDFDATGDRELLLRRRLQGIVEARQLSKASACSLTGGI